MLSVMEPHKPHALESHVPKDIITSGENLRTNLLVPKFITVDIFLMITSPYTS